MVKHTIARQTQETSIDDSNKIQTHIREIINAEKPTIESLNDLMNIVNKKKGTKYMIEFNNYRNYVSEDEINVDVDVNGQPVIHVLRYIAVLLYDFFEFDISETIKNIDEYKSSKEYKEHGFSRLDQAIFRDLLRLFEIERVESCFAMIDEDIGKEFEKDRKHRGLNEYHDDRGLSPITAVLFARDGRYDKLKDTEFEFVSDYLKQVHNMGSSDVSIKLVYDYFQKYVKDWLSNRMRETYGATLERFHEIDMREKREKVNKKFSKSDLKSEIRYKERIKTLKSTISDPVKLTKKLKQCEVSYKKRQNSRIDKLTKARIEISKLARDKSGIELTLMNYTDVYSYEDNIRVNDHIGRYESYSIKYNKKIFDYIPNKSIEELKEYGTQRVNEINEYVKEPINDNIQRKLPEYTNHSITCVNQEPYKINNKVAKSLEYTFKYITDKTYFDKDDDTESKDNPQTIDIIVGVNTSVTYKRHIPLYKKICGTLLASTEKLPNVNIKFVSWYGNENNELYTRIHETHEDIECISSSYELTYTRMAHQYIDDLMSKSTADRKIVIMISDGWIQETYYTTQTVKNSKNSGNEIYCIFSGYYHEERNESIYGKNNIVKCGTIEQIDKALTSLVRDLIGKQ